VTIDAADGSVQSAQSAKIKKILQERFPAIRVDQVNPAPWPGMFEVVAGGEIAYTNNDASLLFAGRVLDTKTQEDLTSKRLSQLNAIAFKTLPLELAIKSVKGNGKRKLAVFADPLCPYCEKLEEELNGVTDVTTYTFLYPLESIHPGASTKAAKIWCSKDPAAAWAAWMLQKTEPAAQACADTPMQKLADLGVKLRINGTPALFFADGHRLDGFLNKEQLEKELGPAK